MKQWLKRLPAFLLAALIVLVPMNLHVIADEVREEASEETESEAYLISIGATLTLDQAPYDGVVYQPEELTDPEITGALDLSQYEVVLHAGESEKTKPLSDSPKYVCLAEDEMYPLSLFGMEMQIENNGTSYILSSPLGSVELASIKELVSPGVHFKNVSGTAYGITFTSDLATIDLFGLTDLSASLNRDGWNGVLLNTRTGCFFVRESALQNENLETFQVSADLNNDGSLSADDAVGILYNQYYPKAYPIDQVIDVNEDGQYDVNDVLYLLYSSLFPRLYPANVKRVLPVLEAAYSLASNGKLNGRYTLTGTITSVQTPYSDQHHNITVVLDVDGQTIQCYRLVGEGTDTIKKDDKVTVFGSISKYNNTVQFDAGCELVRIDEAAPEEQELTTPEEILAAANALEKNESLSKEYALTGEVTSISHPYSQSAAYVTCNMTVLGQTIQCYKLVGENVAEVAIGDTITAKGYLKNYNGTIEFNGCTLLELVKGENQESNYQTPEEILEAAFALEPGTGLDKAYELTGVVTAITYAYNPSAQNPSITCLITVLDKSIKCYRLAGDGIDQVAVGDTITASGILFNYNGEIEFNGCTLTSRTPAEQSGEEDPTESYVFEEVTWTAITSDDVIMITSTKDGKTFAMVIPASASVPPSVREVTISADKISLDSYTDVAFVRETTEGGYMLRPYGETGKYLNITSSNNGIRVTDDTTNAVLNLSDDGYLSGGTTNRYIGVYNNQDWRCYTSIHANIAGQTFRFWKLTNGNTGTGSNEGTGEGTGSGEGSGEGTETGDVTTVTIVSQELGFSNEQEITEAVTKSGITMTFDSNGAQLVPKYYTSGSSIRVYANNTITIDAGESKIRNIKFTYDTAKTPVLSASTGTTAVENGTATWSGDASTVVITVTSGQLRIISVEFTLE